MADDDWAEYSVGGIAAAKYDDCSADVDYTGGYVNIVASACSERT